ncbi:putative defensin-like protein 60 isoform X1 [Capsella rubella]|uniref:putative defensin-like protein 60 isoform X1 n=1 Tax=Capsella rubella TaxID=81985 RepID=UPI000CD4F5C5|nr:putative defensin-like protein 60 isoform X1 [Capsella rubella]
MNITKTYVIFFLVVILTNSFSNINVLASPAVIETSKNDVCFIPCTARYREYECWFDCTYKKFKDGACVNGRCCCKK